MSFITEILNDLKTCCCPFLTQNQSRPTNSLQQRLIEMEHVRKIDQNQDRDKKQTRKKSASCHDARSDDSSLQNKQLKNIILKPAESEHLSRDRKNNIPQHGRISNSKQSRQQKFQKYPKINRDSNIKVGNQQRKSLSQSSSFQTIKSTASRQISRRNFKILRQLSSFYAKHRSADEDFHSINHSQNSSINGQQVHKILAFKFAENNQNVKDGIDRMNVWMKKEYEIYPSKSFKPTISEITKMKLETKDIFDSMVHRLEDYYTFYLEDQHFLQSSEHLENSLIKRINSEIEPQSFNYEEVNHQMICSISKTAYTKSFVYQKTCKFMSLIIIPHCSLSPLAFIQWFNKLQVQSSLHCFNKIQYIENSELIDDNITLEYPLVRVEQFNEKLLGKQTYLLARQLQVVKFENQEDKQTLVEICFEAVDQEKCYERLVRVTAEGAESSRAEIYIESSQNIAKRQTSELLAIMNKKTESEKNYEFIYFEERWKKFEEKLNKAHIINKKPPYIFTS